MEMIKDKLIMTQEEILNEISKAKGYHVVCVYDKDYGPKFFKLLNKYNSIKNVGLLNNDKEYYFELESLKIQMEIIADYLERFVNSFESPSSVDLESQAKVILITRQVLRIYNQEFN